MTVLPAPSQPHPTPIKFCRSSK
ncbi:hypothetical protein A2U01_0086697, partial [Trifolium medium]|nr:hypothetical protein [Trifolium medium]